MSLWPKPKLHLDWWFATKESLCKGKLYNRCNAFLRGFHSTKSKSFLQNHQSCFFLKWQGGKELEIYGKSFKTVPRMQQDPIAPATYGIRSHRSLCPAISCLFCRQLFRSLVWSFLFYTIHYANSQWSSCGNRGERKWVWFASCCCWVFFSPLF